MVLGKSSQTSGSMYQSHSQAFLYVTVEINTMNRIQQVILIIMAALVCTMILFPPYQIIFHGQNGMQLVSASGYALIFDLPFQEDYATHINIALLATPICGVLLVGGLLYIALKTRQRGQLK